ncbi:MAG: hypothetical protein KIC88_07575 [Acinetobacter sp.]|nr:hypothetical protein [Acinetobacter sp.]
MRDLLKVLAVGIVMFFAPFVYAEEYKVLVIPDNIVTENEAVDAYIYNAASEFFANEVINILNQTDYITSPTVSEERKLLKSNPSYMIPARNLTNRFKTSYNIDYVQLKKIANKSQARYVLLLTSAIDSENYILRRTLWDFLNIPGATVVDPAYKICTYAALVDTQKNNVLWSNTFYKTISVVENRIITRGPSPQTEQLQKIRDYSRMLCPEIAQNVQLRVLPPQVYDKESNQIYYDMGNFDNVFTKKYRRWHKEGSKDYDAAKTRVDAKITNTKEKYQQFKEERAQKAQDKKFQKQLEVKAEPVTSEPAAEVIQPSDNNIHNINYKKPVLEDQSLYTPIDIQKTRKNNLYGEFDNSRPPLREYNY